jgi:hypothetical protein
MVAVAPRPIGAAQSTSERSLLVLAGVADATPSIAAPSALAGASDGPAIIVVPVGGFF